MRAFGLQPHYPASIVSQPHARPPRLPPRHASQRPEASVEDRPAGGSNGTNSAAGASDVAGPLFSTNNGHGSSSQHSNHGQRVQPPPLASPATVSRPTPQVTPQVAGTHWNSLDGSSFQPDLTLASMSRAALLVPHCGATHCPGFCAWNKLHWRSQLAQTARVPTRCSRGAPGAAA
jgi:hypothetical protein